MLDETKLLISKMSIQEAYQLYKIFQNQDEQEAIQVRFGITLPYDLDSLFNNTLHITIKTKKGTIKIGQRTYTITNFNTEMNIREKIIKKFLLDNTGSIEITTPRTKQQTTRGITQ